MADGILEMAMLILGEGFVIVVPSGSVAVQSNKSITNIIQSFWGARVL